MTTPIRWSWLALSACLASACSSEDGTWLRLEVTYDAMASLDAMRVQVHERQAPAAASQVIKVRIPDAWAGRSAEVGLWGLDREAAVAYGVAQVTPERGRSVTVPITLVKIPCGAWCSEGATACAGDGVATCEVDADDCMAWSSPSACPADAPSCSHGVCSDVCVDECAEGEWRCEGPAGVRACGEADSDDCLDWLPVEPCADGQVCSHGACRDDCLDECEPGDSLCSGDGTLACGDLNADGCTEWGPRRPCPDGDSCDAGECTSECRDECEGTECTGPLYRQCGQYDFDPCLDQSPGLPCVPTDPCQEGECTPAGCASDDRTCDDPPAAECIDDDTLRVYGDADTCTAGTGCDYPSRDIDCPDCPGCDVCEAIGCDQPPDPVCVDADTVRIYEPTGTCDDTGDCRYAFDDVRCPAGCVGNDCALAIDAGADYTCAYGDRVPVCWGAVGDNSPPPRRFAHVSAGYGYTCAVELDGTLGCWGSDEYGLDRPPAGSFRRVSAGFLHACGIKTDGTIACWGWDMYGQASPPAGTFTSVSAGGYHACGVRPNGSVECWGLNNTGATDVPAGSFSTVTAGGQFTCGLHLDGTIACWGTTEGAQNPPTGAFLTLSDGDSQHICGIRSDRQLYCWGRNDEEQAIPQAGTFRSVTTGSLHTCAIRTDDSVVCWGDNERGQLDPPFD